MPHKWRPILLHYVCFRSNLKKSYTKKCASTLEVVLPKELWPREVPDTDSLIINYLKAWESGWCDRIKFTAEQLLTIRASLFSVISYRYAKHGEITFSRNELKEAIKSAKDIAEPYNSRSDRSMVNPICHAYVFLFIQRWEEAEKFSPDELSTIFAQLYLSTIDRYEASSRSKLFVTKREIKRAVEFAESARARREKEAYQDSRDKQIRELRGRYGSVAEIRTLLHE